MVQGKGGSYAGRVGGLLHEEMPWLKVPCHGGVKEMEKGEMAVSGRSTILRWRETALIES